MTGFQWLLDFVLFLPSVVPSSYADILVYVCPRYLIEKILFCLSTQRHVTVASPARSLYKEIHFLSLEHHFLLKS